MYISQVEKPERDQTNVEGRGHNFVPKTPEEHVKNANLLLTISILLVQKL